MNRKHFNAESLLDTPITSSGTTAETLAGPIAQTPLKRLTTPEEIAEAAIWLCSDAASSVIRQTLLIDGGYAIPGNRFRPGNRPERKSLPQEEVRQAF